MQETNEVKDDGAEGDAAPQADSRREAMLKLVKSAAYVAPATLGYLAATKSAAAY